MARIISLIVLLVVVLVIAGLFFQVMANFVVPMFLAVLLVIMFGPVHRWFVARCGGRVRLAAGLTTTTIMLIFLVPLMFILFRAITEGVGVYHKLEPGQMDIQKFTGFLVRAGAQVGLDLNAEDMQNAMITKAQQWLTPLALSTTHYVGSLLIAMFVMVISLYYFLADGPAMVRSLMRLSPMEDRYQQQLVEQFVNVSRAVVLATLLSAAAQALLAGIGFYFAGLSAIFLLMVLTMLLSMVPFIGSPAVWVPGCLWIYFYQDRPGAAIGLAIYGAVIVSTVDNIVKPWVLHGRSNLHPLLALLSVLGGLQAMGPIGIFVGPMAVAFLQTLLNILHAELEAMRSGAERGGGLKGEG